MFENRTFVEGIVCDRKCWNSFVCCVHLHRRNARCGYFLIAGNSDVDYIEAKTKLDDIDSFSCASLVVEPAFKVTALVVVYYVSKNIKRNRI